MRVYPMKDRNGRVVYSVVHQYRSKRFRFTPKGKLRKYWPAGACWFDARPGDEEGLCADFSTLEAILRAYRAGYGRCGPCKGVGSVDVEITYRGRRSKMSEECTTCSGSGVVPAALTPEGKDG